MPLLAQLAQGLLGARLDRALFTKANLTRALADQATEWPEGFDPVAARVIFV